MNIKGVWLAMRYDTVIGIVCQIWSFWPWEKRVCRLENQEYRERLSAFTQEVVDGHFAYGGLLG